MARKSRKRQAAIYAAKREKWLEKAQLSRELKTIKTELSVHRVRLEENPTKTEALFAKRLKSLYIRYEFQRMFYNQSFRCITDFFIKGGNVKIVVEIDGGYHFTPTQQRKDKYREDWIKEKQDCEVIRFTNEEVLNDMDGCLLKLANLFLSISTIDCHNKQVFMKFKRRLENADDLTTDLGQFIALLRKDFYVKECDTYYRVDGRFDIYKRGKIIHDLKGKVYLRFKHIEETKVAMSCLLLPKAIC